LISRFLVMLATIRIFGILVGFKCSHILGSNLPTLLFASEGDNTFILPSEGVADCISLSSEGDDTASYTTKESERDTQCNFGSLHGFTSSFADGDTEKLNTQIHFDIDSVFFVCDNSTTVTSATTFESLFLELFIKQTKVSLLQMELVHVCKRELFDFL
jgi:hypothetical protein